MSYVLSQATCDEHHQKGCPLCYEPLDLDDYQRPSPDDADRQEDRTMRDIREAEQHDYWDELARLRAERNSLK